MIQRRFHVWSPLRIAAIETAPSSVTGLACAQFRYRGAWSPTHLRTLLQLTALLSNHSNQIVQHVYNIHNDGTIIDHPDRWLFNRSAAGNVLYFRTRSQVTWQSSNFNLKWLQHPGRRLSSLVSIEECIYRYCDNLNILNNNDGIEYGNEQWTEAWLIHDLPDSY